MSTIAVAGATGFVGRALIARLLDEGHDVVALSRRSPSPPLPAAVRHLPVDVGDRDRLASDLSGVDHAYYLVHSMEAGSGFAERDRALAASFGAAAASAGVRRIVYLGGLGDDPASEHLASRQEVGQLLASGGVDVVELRAAVVLGAGSISFEMLRYLTERLPLMVCPRWVHTRIQPIALADLLDYLTAALACPHGVYEIGGADVTTYREMISAYARVRGLPRRLVLDVPLLTPHLSSYWVDAVTPVNRQVSHALIESLTTEVVVTDPGPTREAFGTEPFGIEPLGLDAALSRALDDQADGLADELFSLPDGPHHGVYAMQVRLPLGRGEDRTAVTGLAGIGGDLGWYGVPRLWRVRVALGRLWGEDLCLGRPDHLDTGAAVDWWTVASVDPHRLVLRTDWKVGEAWLGYRVEPPDAGHDGAGQDGAGQDGRAPVLAEAGALRPRGVLGFLYWKLLEPIHRTVFAAMARRRVRDEIGPAPGERRGQDGLVEVA